MDHPEPQELMGAAEIARRLGVSPGRVHQILAADPAFPKPRARLSMGKVWEAADIERWITEHRPGQAAALAESAPAPPAWDTIGPLVGFGPTAGADGFCRGCQELPTWCTCTTTATPAEENADV